MRARPLAALLLLAACCGAEADEAGWREIGVEARPMAFAAPEGGPLAFRGALSLRSPEGAFGGLSGIVMEGPRAALAISDAGRWARLRLRIEGGRLEGVEGAALAPILTRRGAFPPRWGRDAEALARDPETGRVWVAFEQFHRLVAFDEPGGPAARMRFDEDWLLNFEGNGGFEALALAPGGRLLAIREEAEGGAHPVWVETGGGWETGAIPARPPYRPTGADFGPDGRLYVTERAFSFTAGFRFRLRRFRFAPDAWEPAGEETLLELGAETMIDNVEGVTLWREEGRDYLLLVTDDNFLPVERTILALFEVTG